MSVGRGWESLFICDAITYIPYDFGVFCFILSPYALLLVAGILSIGSLCYFVGFVFQSTMCLFLLIGSCYFGVNGGGLVVTFLELFCGVLANWLRVFLYWCLSIACFTSLFIYSLALC